MSSDMVTRLAASGETAAAAPSLWLHFAEICDALTRTRAKLTKRKMIADYLRLLDADTAGLAAQYCMGAIFPDSDERKVQVGGSLAVRAIKSATGASTEEFHAAYRRYGDVGAAAEELMRSGRMPSKGLSLVEIAERTDALAARRTQSEKMAVLTETLGWLSPLEAKYWIKLLLADMRMGVQQSLVEEAVAEAAEEPVTAIRRAETLLGDMPAVVALAWEHALETARFRMFHALGFMLATPAASAEEAWERLNSAPAQMEDKYDGMRAQLHCGDPQYPGRVRIFSRTREDVTGSFPELAEWFSCVQAPAVLDGEILAWDFERERALPFTALQQRLGRKRVTATMRESAPVVYMAFDLLVEGDVLLLDSPLAKRRPALEAWAGDARTRERSSAVGSESVQADLFATEASSESHIVRDRLQLAPILAVSNAVQIDAAFDMAQRRGNEGLMLKSLASVYEPGRRGGAWLKLKRELATLDVVVTAVEYGHGRRADVLSDYTFAVRDGAGLKNVGKAYSGLTDVEIADQTQWFLAHTLEARGSQLLVEPKIVLEVAFNNVMRSERHDSGYSLRFPRIARIRTDKPVEEIDTVQRVAEIFRMQHAGETSTSPKSG